LLLVFFVSTFPEQKYGLNEGDDVESRTA